MVGNTLAIKLSQTLRQSLLHLAWLGAFLLTGCDSSTTEPDKPDQDPTSNSSAQRSSSETDNRTTTTTSSSSKPHRLSDHDKILDPAEDGWETETFSAAASNQLKEIGELLAHPDTIDTEHCRLLAHEQFACEPLRPANLATIYEDQTFLVTRGPDKQNNSSDSSHQGIAGLATALRDLTESFLGAQHVHVKFKLYKIDPQGDAVVTRSYFTVDGKTKSGSAQQNAIWVCRWERTQGDAPPRLLSITTEHHEDIAAKPSTASTLYVDCTESALAAEPAFSKQLQHGMAYWSNQLDVAQGLDRVGHHGLAVGDINGDGLEDVYLCQAGGLPNLLLVQQEDGTVRNMATAAGVDFLDWSAAALILDLDNDGDQDLIVGTIESYLVLENDGQGKFTRRASLPGSSSYGLAAADYDEDGDLDFYVCMYFNQGEAKFRGLPFPVPYHDANNGQSNILYRNNGNWNFTDATALTGLDQDNQRFSFAAAWEDYDNDGDVDLYVANDFGRNCLYRNDEGRFKNVAAEVGVEDIASGMSVTWGDYDRDGWMDLYISNMFSSAGNRIAFQRKFTQDLSHQKASHIQRMARGNTLFRNNGGNSFHDVSETAEVTMGRWAWSSLFADINNDGWSDLLVTNGFITGNRVHDL